MAFGKWLLEFSKVAFGKILVAFGIFEDGFLVGGKKVDFGAGPE